jgi:hypothetical protein
MYRGQWYEVIALAEGTYAVTNSRSEYARYDVITGDMEQANRIAEDWNRQAENKVRRGY